jgi:hypothetical protein
MSKGYASAAISANLQGVISDPRKVQRRTQTLAVMRVARGLFETKLVAQLVAITDASESTVKRWLRGDQEMSFEHFRALLHSENGLEFLSAAMADSPSLWWRLVKVVAGAALARKMQAKANAMVRRAVSGALKANAKNNAGLERAAALLVQDEDFFGEHVAASAAFRAGTLAQETKRKR